MSKRMVVRIDSRAFFRGAIPKDGRQAEWAIPLRVGRYRAMLGISAPTNEAAKRVLDFIGLRVEENTDG